MEMKVNNLKLVDQLNKRNENTERSGRDGGMEKLLFANIIRTVGKGKAVPLQVWSGPEGSRKLRFPDYMTTAQDGGKVVSLTHRPPLPTGNAPGTHFC
jgi:hypothetical protein